MGSRVPHTSVFLSHLYLSVEVFCHLSARLSHKGSHGGCHLLANSAHSGTNWLRYCPWGCHSCKAVADGRMHLWAGGRGLKQHKFILGTSSVTSTYPRASLPPEAPGEGPSCLSQCLGAPTVPGLVATSLLCLPLCPHGFSVSVSLVFCPLQGHSLDLGPPAPVGHILRSRVDMDFGGHYSASTAEIVFFQSSGGRGQEVPEPLNGSSPVSIREPHEEAACPSVPSASLAPESSGPSELSPCRL